VNKACKCNAGKGSDIGGGNCIDRGSIGMGYMGEGSAREGNRNCIGKGSLPWGPMHMLKHWQQLSIYVTPC
jgi:hypothetical protein